MRTLVLSTAIATLAAVGAASAQPVTLSENQMDKVTAGTATDGGWSVPPFQLAVQKTVAVQVQKLFAIKNLTESLPVLQGNFNDAEAAATAVGRASFTQTMTQGEAVQNQFSRGFSESVAAANRPARTD
jgi:hypothetical protein